MMARLQMPVAIWSAWHKRWIHRTAVNTHKLTFLNTGSESSVLRLTLGVPGPTVGVPGLILGVLGLTLVSLI